MDAHLAGSVHVLRGVIEEYRPFGFDAKTLQCQLVEIGVGLEHLLLARHDRAVENFRKLRKLLEGEMNGLVRPVRKPPYAITGGFQVA